MSKRAVAGAPVDLSNTVFVDEIATTATGSGNEAEQVAEAIHNQNLILDEYLPRLGPTQHHTKQTSIPVLLGRGAKEVPQATRGHG